MRIVFAILLTIVSWNGYCQVNLSRYIEHIFVPTVKREEFVDVDFTWNLPGKSQTYLNEGLTQLKESNFVVAAENFREVIALNADFWPAYYYLGVSEKAIGLRTAEKNLSTAIELSGRWEAHYQLGDHYQLQKAYEKAIIHYEKALELNDFAVQAAYQLGNVSFAQGNVKKALKYYSFCNELDPKFPLPYVMHALIKAKENKRNKESLDYLNRALSVDPNCSEALYWRGFLLLHLEQKQKALLDWSSLIERHPNVPFFHFMRAFLSIELGDFDMAFNDLRKALPISSATDNTFSNARTIMDDRADIQFATNYSMQSVYGLNEAALSFFKKGFCHFLMDSHQPAISAFNDALAADPAAVIFFMKGMTFEFSNNIDSAYVNYDRALGLDKEIFDALRKRGLYRFKAKNYDGASGDFSEMIRIDPASIIGYALRGLVSFEKADYAGSVSDFTEFIQRDSTDDDIFWRRGYSFSQLKEYKKATKDFARALSLAPGKQVYYGYLLDNLLNEGDTIGAYRIADECIKRFMDASAYQYRIRLCIAQRRWDEALANINEAIGTMGTAYYSALTMSDLLFLRGLIYFNMNKFEDCIGELSRSLKEDARNDQSRYYRSKAYVQVGRLRDARQDLKDLSARNYLDSRQLLAEFK